MDAAAFLPGFSDEPTRRRLWAAFERAEAEGREFALPGNFVEIASVIAGEADDWSAGRITLNARSADAAGVLLSLVFRSAFERCRFHDSQGDELWRDALCDVFRYFVERALQPAEPSAWVARVESLIGQPIEAARARADWDAVRDGRRTYPAARMIDWCRRDFALFQRVWFDLQEQRMQANQPLLSWKLGYAMPE